MTDSTKITAEEIAKDCIGAFNTRHKPSAHAMGVLMKIWDEPFPAQEMNFTVRDKLMAFGYIELVPMPSPYKSHKDGRLVDFAVITQKGRSAL